MKRNYCKKEKNRLPLAMKLKKNTIKKKIKYYAGIFERSTRNDGDVYPPR
jgi:hypothetical protein